MSLIQTIGRALSLADPKLLHVDPKVLEGAAGAALGYIYRKTGVNLFGSDTPPSEFEIQFKKEYLRPLNYVFIGILLLVILVLIIWRKK